MITNTKHKPSKLPGPLCQLRTELKCDFIGFGQHMRKYVKTELNRHIRRKGKIVLQKVEE